MRKYKKKATFSRSISSFLSILWIFLIYLSVSLIKFLYYIQYCFFWRKCVNITVLKRNSLEITLKKMAKNSEICFGEKLTFFYWKKFGNIKKN